MDIAGLADAEGGRRIECGGGDEHRGEADQRMERGDELRHRRHRDAPRDHRADAAADRDAEHDQQEPAPARRGEEQRRHHGDGHAGDAELVAAARAFRARQAAEREDEEDACDQIEDGSEIGAHGHSSTAVMVSAGNSTPVNSG